MELIKCYASNKKLPCLRVKIVQNLELAALNFAKILYIHKKGGPILVFSRFTHLILILLFLLSWSFQPPQVF